MKSDEYDKDYHREKDIEYHSLAMDDRGLLHTLFASATSTSIDNNIKPSIDDHPTTNLEVQVKDNTNYGYPTPDEFGIFRDSEGQARVMDGHILHISNEDIAEIIAMNGCSNLYIPKNRSDDLPSIDDAEAPSIDGHFESRRSILHPNRKRKPRWENTEVSIPTVPDQNNYNKTELMRDRYDSENSILKQNHHHRSTERLDDRSTVTMQHYEASWTSQNQHMPDLEYNNAALGVFNIGCMQVSRIRTQQYPEQQPITAQRQQRLRSEEARRRAVGMRIVVWSKKNQKENQGADTCHRPMRQGRHRSTSQHQKRSIGTTLCRLTSTSAISRGASDAILIEPVEAYEWMQPRGSDSVDEPEWMKTRGCDSMDYPNVQKEDPFAIYVRPITRSRSKKLSEKIACLVQNQKK
ncbi:hypothetical protein Bca4012_089209 [Brassica carinata]